MNAPGKILKYSASAGSGKTHALTGFYLSRVLHDPAAYRRILAVTFTNSAATEMKNRILKRLNILGSDDSEGEKERDEFVAYLCMYFPDIYPDRELAMVRVKKNAPVALKNIMQDYSRFTVGTIDSFFQKVIRAFAREIDMPSGYEIELEHDAILSDAVDSLLADVASDRQLLEWISSYVASRLDDNRGWDIRREIMDVSAQIFGENFRQLSEDDRKKIGDYEVMQEYTKKVFTIKRSFESELKRLASRGTEIYEGCGLTADDFYLKRHGGVGESLRRYAHGDVKPPNNTWNKAASDGKFIAGGAPQKVVESFEKAVNEGLGEVVRGISELFAVRYPLYVSALAQVRTIHVMGILGAISERVRSLAQDENLFLLSDSGELIGRLIADDDAPFIYEKIGTTYDHYIIDEFQDTSQIQWKNFRPLIGETLSRGKDNLVVGDVKQSIYRWRNSDWRIIHSGISQAFGEDAIRTIALSSNYRSRTNIIRFNNLVFAPDALPALCDSRLNNENIRISDIYSGSVQEGTGEKEGGYVRVALYRKPEEGGWREKVMHDLPALVEKIQEHGYSADDILILCRTNDEGKSIINSILDYSSSCPAEKLEKFNYEVTSGESLFLERNPAVTLLLSCLRFLIEPASLINRSLMVRSYILASRKDEALIYTCESMPDAEPPLPEGWEDELNRLRNSSLFSAIESMIRFFSLVDNSENTAFISSFQDVVLAYSGRYSSDITSFINWWNQEGCRSTISQSDRQDAMRVMTIHKAKGLQSRIVIIPFMSWDFSKRGFSRPLLWVNDVPEAFAPMPVVLPELSSRLSESVFAAPAATEQASEWLDGVNLMYVAFTRAADALFIMVPEVTKRTSGGAGAESLLNEVLCTLPDDFIWHENESCRYFEYGELPPAEEPAREVPIVMSGYTVTEPRGDLRLRTGGVLPQDEMKLAEPGGRAYGIMMHELLSMISTTDDIDRAVEHVCDMGLLPAAQHEETALRVRQMLSADTVREWFDGSSAVKTEAAILLPSGAARRPDRVMIRHDSVTVVDYKFGEPADTHRRQAKEYRDLIRAMGYKNVTSWLWYVEKDIIEEV
jgi:ATP-dependent helicase/nuclease subunit A